jgi:hypothetical protein
VTPANVLPQQSYYAPLDAWAERVVTWCAHGMYLIGIAGVLFWGLA